MTGAQSVADRSGTALALTAVVMLVSLLPLGRSELKYLVLATLIALGSLLLRPVASLSPISLQLALLIAWLLATLLWSVDRYTGTTSILWIVSMLLLAAMAGHFHDRFDRLVALLLAVGALVCSIGIAQSRDWLGHDHWADAARHSGPFVNSNIYAAFVGSILLLSIGFALDGGWRARMFGGLTGLLALLNLPLTASRGGWLATAVGGLALAAVRTWRKPRPHPRGPASKRLVVLAMVLASAVVIWSVAATPLGVELERRLHDAGSQSARHRGQLYAGTIEMARQNPLGVGAGSFSAAFPNYRLHSDRFLVRFAHCEPLELLAVAGIPGFSLALLIVGGLVAILRNVAEEPSPATSGGFAALVLVSTQSLYDFPLRQPTLAVMASLLAGALVAAQRIRKSRVPLRGVAIVVVAVSAVLLRGEQLRAQAQQLELHGSPFEAARRYQLADRWLFPGDPELTRRQARLAVRLARVPLLGDHFMRRAADLYRRALTRDPRDGESWLASGALSRALDSESPERARECFLAAARASPRDGYVVGGAARGLSELGDVVPALRLYSSGMALTPGRIPPSQVADLFRTSAVPAELLAPLVPASSDHTGELIERLGADGAPLAARLLESRRAARWASTGRVSP